MKPYQFLLKVRTRRCCVLPALVNNAPLLHADEIDTSTRSCFATAENSRYASTLSDIDTPPRFHSRKVGSYAASVQLRNILYTYGIFKARRLPCRVISVGNIVVGGTGKTPAVIAIAKHLQREGMRVAILLRGYKRRVREKVTIVSDGEKVCTSPIESGDEAYMMAKHLRNVPIIVGKCRYSAGQVALERFKVDVLLLDDGFQHRQLERDVDILTIPTTHPFGSPEKLLPAGTLREPLTALRRADLILLTHADTPNISAHIQKN